MKEEVSKQQQNSFHHHRETNSSCFNSLNHIALYNKLFSRQRMFFKENAFQASSGAREKGKTSKRIMSKVG
jgi:hypothetical protein